MTDHEFLLDLHERISMHIATTTTVEPKPFVPDPRYAEAVEKGLPWVFGPFGIRAMGNGAFPDWWMMDRFNAEVKFAGNKPFRDPPEWEKNIYTGPQPQPDAPVVDRSGTDLGVGPSPKLFEGRANESKHYSLTAERPMLIKTGRAQSTLGACNRVRIRVDGETQEAIADASTIYAVAPGVHVIEVTLLEDGAVAVEAT